MDICGVVGIGELFWLRKRRFFFAVTVESGNISAWTFFAIILEYFAFSAEKANHWVGFFSQLRWNGQLNFRLEKGAEGGS